MSATDIAVTFAHGLALGLFYGAFAVLIPCVLFGLIFWAQDRRARKGLPRQRRGVLPVSPPTEGPRPSGRRAGPTGVAALDADAPRGVTLLDWRAERRREREQAR